MRALVALAVLAATPALAAPAAQTQCLDRRHIESIRPDGDRALVFRMTGRDYRGELAQACAFRPGFDTIETRSTAFSLCAGEPLRVTAQQTGAYRGACVVERFTAVAPAR